jgi:hypothetical protein
MSSRLNKSCEYENCFILPVEMWIVNSNTLLFIFLAFCDDLSPLPLGHNVQHIVWVILIAAGLLGWLLLGPQGQGRSPWWIQIQSGLFKTYYLGITLVQAWDWTGDLYGSTLYPLDFVTSERPEIGLGLLLDRFLFSWATTILGRSPL